MLPELIFNINGQGVVVPGALCLTVAIIVYMVIGTATLGRKTMKFWVKRYYGGNKADIPFYYLGALIFSVVWLPWLVFRLIVICILRPLLMDKFSKEEIVRVEKPH